MDMVDNAKKRMLREGSLLRQATIRLKKEKESSPASQAVSLLEGGSFHVISETSRSTTSFF